MRLPGAIVLSFVLLLTSLAAQQVPQDSGVRLRASTELVAIDVSVTDAAGRFVGDLDAGDFELRDDGAPRAIEVFQRVSLPVPAAVPRGGQPPVSDVRSNAERPEQRRLYVIAIDELHIARPSAAKAKQALHAFIDRAVLAGDMAAVLFMGGSGAPAQEFTPDRARLHAAVDRLSGMKLRPATAEKLDDPGLNTSGIARPDADIYANERIQRGRASLETLRTLADYLAQVPMGRKSLIFVSEGPENEAPDRSLRGRSAQSLVDTNLRAAIGALNRANVVVFPLDPRGVTIGQETLIESSSTFDVQGIGGSSARTEVARSLGTLQTLATGTGGTTLLWRPDMSREFQRVMETSGSYYILGYQPSAPSTDARDITISVRRRGVVVHGRQGFRTDARPVAVPDWAQTFAPAIARAIAAPLPVAGLGMSMQAMAFLEDGQPAQVMNLAVDVGSAAVADDAARGVRLALVAIDGAGRVRTSETQAVTLASGVSPAQSTVRFNWFTELPPGEYQIRVAAEDTLGRVGSVTQDLRVPDYGKSRLVVTPLALGDQEAPAHILGTPSRSATLWLERVTLQRAFRQNTEIRVAAEAYWRDRDNASVAVSAELLTAAGERVLSIPVDVRPRQQAALLTATATLGVPPGAYRIRFVGKRKGEESISEVPVWVN